MVDMGQRKLEGDVWIQRRKRPRIGLRGLSLMAMHNPPHPGEFIRETYIEPFDISIRSLAENLGVAASTLARIVSERSGAGYPGLIWPNITQSPVLLISSPQIENPHWNTGAGEHFCQLGQGDNWFAGLAWDIPCPSPHLSRYVIIMTQCLTQNFLDLAISHINNKPVGSFKKCVLCEAGKQWDLNVVLLRGLSAVSHHKPINKNLSFPSSHTKLYI